jgi:hypothetical protein
MSKAAAKVARNIPDIILVASSYILPNINYILAV